MKVRALTLLVLLALFTVVGSVFAQDEEGGDTIADIVVASANAEEAEFSTLLAAVQAADPAILEALSNPDASLTVFAPTDAAFAALPGFVLDYVLADQALLTSTLQYHVVDGVVMSTDVVGLLAENDGVVTVDTLAGSAVTVAGNAEEGVTVDQANVVLEMVDIEAANGVIHVIDAVLVPPITLEYEPPAFVEGSINSAGSSTVGPLTETINSRYIEEAGGDDAAITIDNQITGSSTGFARFCEEGTTDFSNASRAIRDTEVESCEAIGRTPVEIRVGTDALSVVVHPENTWATDVTIEELAQLFGTATTWADVREGWPDEEIIRYTPGEESGTFDFFNEVVFEEDATIPLAASNLTTNGDDNVLLLGVSENVNAIGYFGYAYYINNADQVDVLDVAGVTPSADSVEATGEEAYPLARPLFIYIDAGVIAEKPEVGEYVKYYLENVNDVIGGVGYFPANPFRLNIAKLVILALTDGMMMDEM